MISCNDLKNLHLLSPSFPEFIGQGAARRDCKGERKDCVGSSADNAHQATLHTQGSQGEAHTEHLPKNQNEMSSPPKFCFTPTSTHVQRPYVLLCAIFVFHFG